MKSPLCVVPRTASRLAVVFFVAGLLQGVFSAFAAPAACIIKLRTDRPDALYACQQTARFHLSVFVGDQPLTEGTVKVTLSLDGGKVLRQEEVSLTAAGVSVEGTLEEPGFLRLTVTIKHGGKRISGFAAAGFEPERITPMTPLPDDFDAFWATGKRQRDTVPLDLRMTRLDTRCTAKADVFAISFANIMATRVYGFLCVPKGQTGPFPAWVTVPGAGPGPFGPSGRAYAERGVLALTVGVHAYDTGTLTKEEIKVAYAELNKEVRYSWRGAPDRKAYYFYRAYLGIDRAVSWLASRTDFDGRHLVIDGSSQGGGSALILAGLNPHITAAAANVPALCDHGGYLAERAPGWPRLVQGATADDRAPYLAMAAYFDAVNFARRITCPVILSAGFIDRTCSPSSVYAAYSVISSPKRIFNGPLNGHEWNVGDYRGFLSGWVDGQLGLAPVRQPALRRPGTEP